MPLFSATLFNPVKKEELASSTVYSLLPENEPRFTDLVDNFVKELPTVNDTLHALAETEEWDELKENVHVLKGSGGHFGFPVLTEIAREIELLLIAKNYKNVGSLLT